MPVMFDATHARPVGKEWQVLAARIEAVTARQRTIAAAVVLIL